MHRLSPFDIEDIDTPDADRCGVVIGAPGAVRFGRPMIIGHCHGSWTASSPPPSTSGCEKVLVPFKD